MSVDLLNQLACEFRSALEIVVNEKQYGRLKIFGSFPNECCRYTSDLLAEYLVNNDIARKRIQMVESETLEEEYTHCWLMIDSTLFVDITADQFNKSPYFRKYAPIPACCVVPLDTYLYECFDGRKTQYTRNIGIDSYSGEVAAKLQAVYEAVMRQIKTNRKGEQRYGFLH